MPNDDIKFGTPRRSPTNANGHHEHSSRLSLSYLKLAALAILFGAFLFTARDNYRLRSGDDYALSSDWSDRDAYDDADDDAEGTRAEPSYSILPKKIYSVIGLESSGTQFVSKIIENALDLPRPYREGSAPCRVTKCADESDQSCSLMNHIVGIGHACTESGDVQVQHFSLPWGGSCHQHPDPPVVDVVLPPQCTRDHHDNPTEVEECNAMAMDTWGFKLNGKAMKYPIRYQLDIVKNKEWYARQGVEQVFVIVVRDQKISNAARDKHCKDPILRQQEEDIGTNLIINAINTYILRDDTNVTNKTLNYWVAKQYQQKDRHDRSLRQRMLGALPSKGGVVVVSYESLVKLGDTYVKMLYEALGIESTFVPDVRDSNEKYLNNTFT